jgi:hypothetical protein
MKCRCASDKHGHKPGKCKNLATETHHPLRSLLLNHLGRSGLVGTFGSWQSSLRSALA